MGDVLFWGLTAILAIGAAMPIGLRPGTSESGVLALCLVPLTFLACRSNSRLTFGSRFIAMEIIAGLFFGNQCLLGARYSSSHSAVAETVVCVVFALLSATMFAAVTSAWDDAVGDTSSDLTCRHCGYSLRQLESLRCPECGTPIEKA